jgi:hypothetical protein
LEAAPTHVFDGGAAGSVQPIVKSGASQSRFMLAGGHARLPAIALGGYFLEMAMRKFLLAAVVSTACISGAQALEQTGTIISIDAAAKTFVCEWKDKSWTYRTTDKTSFRNRGKNGTFSDLKSGVRVNVGYHTDDKGRIADWINIEER